MKILPVFFNAIFHKSLQIFRKNSDYLKFSKELKIRKISICSVNFHKNSLKSVDENFIIKENFTVTTI